MIDDVPFVELAKYCIRTCHVLKAATEMGVDGLSGPVEEAIESLEKYVDPASLSGGASPRVHRIISCPVEDGDTGDFRRF